MQLPGRGHMLIINRISHGYMSRESGQPAEKCSYIISQLLFPTNRRPYGWDWQGPGLQNAIQTLEYFASALPGVPEEQLKSYAANPNLVLFHPYFQCIKRLTIEQVIYAGHSMGGHGCWTISTHYPGMPIYSIVFFLL